MFFTVNVSLIYIQPRVIYALFINNFACLHSIIIIIFKFLTKLKHVQSRLYLCQDILFILSICHEHGIFEAIIFTLLTVTHDPFIYFILFKKKYNFILI